MVRAPGRSGTLPKVNKKKETTDIHKPVGCTPLHSTVDNLPGTIENRCIVAEDPPGFFTERISHN